MIKELKILVNLPKTGSIYQIYPSETSFVRDLIANQIEDFPKTRLDFILVSSPLSSSLSTSLGLELKPSYHPIVGEGQGFTIVGIGREIKSIKSFLVPFYNMYGTLSSVWLNEDLYNYTGEHLELSNSFILTNFKREEDEISLLELGGAFIGGDSDNYSFVKQYHVIQDTIFKFKEGVLSLLATSWVDLIKQGD